MSVLRLLYIYIYISLCVCVNVDMFVCMCMSTISSSCGFTDFKLQTCALPQDNKIAGVLHESDGFHPSRRVAMWPRNSLHVGLGSNSGLSEEPQAPSYFDFILKGGRGRWWPLCFDFGSLADRFYSRPGAFYQKQQSRVSPTKNQGYQGDVGDIHTCM